MEEKNDSHLIFYNHLILESIFHHLDHDDLKTVRLVCTQWDDVARPILSSKSVVVLNESSRLEAFCDQIISTGDYMCDPCHIKVSDINLSFEDLQCLNTLWAKTAFATGLASIQIDLAPPQAVHIFSNLFNTCTFYNLKELKVRMLKFFPDYQDDLAGEKPDIGMGETEDDSLYKQLTQCVTKYPSLSSFSYMYYSFDGSDENWPSVWMSLLQQLHNIQELMLTGVSGTFLDQLLSLIWIFKSIDKSRFPLKHFEILIGNTLSNDHISRISHLELTTLERLSLEIGPKVDELELQSLFYMCSPSLRHIQLRAVCVGTPSFEFTPNIFQHCHSRLKILDITDGFISCLDFVVFLPNLVDLKIRYRNLSRLSQTEMIQRTDSSVYHTSLQSLHVEENISGSCIKRLSTMFPFLSHIHLRVDDELLRIVFEWMPGLQSLSIVAKVFGESCEFNGNKVTCSDKGITGIPLRYMEWGASNVIKHRFFRYIGDLKGLEILSIESWNGYGHGITDLSVMYGLVELTKLRHVHLIRTLVSDQGIDALTSKGVTVTTSSN